MLTFILAVAGAAMPTAIDAERAFARDAQRNGQWTLLAISNLAAWGVRG